MTIRLCDIQCHAFHGVLEEEKKEGNLFRVNIAITIDDVVGMHSDDIQDTLDYRCISNIVAREMAIPSDLIEHVAWRIKHALQLSFPQATDIRVAVAKKNPPLSLQVAWAEVEI